MNGENDNQSAESYKSNHTVEFQELLVNIESFTVHKSICIKV